MRPTTGLSLVLCCLATACADLPPITNPDNTQTTTVTPAAAQTFRGYVRRAEPSAESPSSWSLELRNGQLIPLAGADAMLQSRENADVLVVGTFVAGVLQVQSCSPAADNQDEETRRGRRPR